MKFKRLITTIDSHTEGQATRVVVAGFPNLPGKTMAGKKDFMRQNFECLRTAILHEPRGATVSTGGIITPPVTEEAAFGIIWLEFGEGTEGRYIDMCGHGSIGVAVTAVEMGIVEPKEPVTEVAFDTPAGLVHARVNVEDGRAKSVTIQNVPSFLYKTEVINVPDRGELKVDIAFGGINYAFVEAKDLGIGTSAADINNAHSLIAKVIIAVNEQVKIQHPEKPYIKGVCGLQITDKPTHPEATVRSICTEPVVRETLDSDVKIDRSPCGTGTSARMAVRHAKGELAIGETFVTESVLGLVFYGKLVRETNVGGIKAVVPEVTGRAFITGVNQLMIDEDDPLKYGYLL